MLIRILRSNLGIENAKQVFDAYREIKEFESKNVFIDRLISANVSIFKEVMGMSKNPLFQKIVLEVAAERGWFDMEKGVLTDKFFMDVAEERGWLDEIHRKEREEGAREGAKEIARGLKQDNIPIHFIVKNTGLTLQEVEAL